MTVIATSTVEQSAHMGAEALQFKLVATKSAMARGRSVTQSAEEPLFLRSTAWAEGDAVSARGCLQRPERAGLVRIAVAVSHIGLALLFDEHPPTAARRDRP